MVEHVNGTKFNPTHNWIYSFLCFNYEKVFRQKIHPGEMPGDTEVQSVLLNYKLDGTYCRTSPPASHDPH